MSEIVTEFANMRRNEQPQVEKELLIAHFTSSN